MIGDLFIPAMLGCNPLERERVDVFTREHSRGKSLTLDVVQGIEQGDWEQVLRVVSRYVHFLGLHMRQEETELFQLAETSLPAEVAAELRRAFDACNAEALGVDGAERYRDIGTRLAGSSTPPALPWRPTGPRQRGALRSLPCGHAAARSIRVTRAPLSWTACARILACVVPRASPRSPEAPHLRAIRLTPRVGWP